MWRVEDMRGSVGVEDVRGSVGVEAIVLKM